MSGSACVWEGMRGEGGGWKTSQKIKILRSVRVGGGKKKKIFLRAACDDDDDNKILRNKKNYVINNVRFFYLFN